MFEPVSDHEIIILGGYSGYHFSRGLWIFDTKKLSIDLGENLPFASNKRDHHMPSIALPGGRALSRCNTHPQYADEWQSIVEYNHSNKKVTKLLN